MILVIVAFSFAVGLFVMRMPKRPASCYPESYARPYIVQLYEKGFTVTWNGSFNFRDDSGEIRWLNLKMTSAVRWNSRYLQLESTCGCILISSRTGYNEVELHAHLKPTGHFNSVICQLKINCTSNNFDDKRLTCYKQTFECDKNSYLVLDELTIESW